MGNRQAFAWLITQNIGQVPNTKPIKGYWTCEMNNIYNNLNNIYDIELYGKYLGNDVLLILGGNSYKYNPTTFVDVFPNLTPKNIRVIPGAGHWVHAEKPEGTKIALMNFLHWLDSQR